MLVSANLANRSYKQIQADGKMYFVIKILDNF